MELLLPECYEMFKHLYKSTNYWVSLSINGSVNIEKSLFSEVDIVRSFSTVQEFHSFLIARMEK